MKLHKCFRYALNLVINSKLRSWLTIIGIVIGVASVISIVAVGDGMESEINDQLGDLGVDTITITPGASKGQSFGPHRSKSITSSDTDPITNKEIQVLKGMTEVDSINGVISGRADVKFIGSSGSLTVTGIDTSVMEIFVNDDLDEGRYLGPSDSNVIVIGYDLAHEYFDDEVGINKIITIEEKAFRVVGILEDGTRNTIYMSIDTAVNILDDKEKNEYDQISVILKEGYDIDEITEDIKSKIMIKRHVTEKDIDFSVSNSAQINEMRSEMIGTLTTFLTAIAAISLLVGAVGIANTMFTAVLEKTKEIGIMKAIGAKNRDILIIFLFNSAIIGLIGGLLGVTLGIVMSAILNTIGMVTIVTFEAVAISLAVAILSGIIAGYIPAKQGSTLKPVDALRYE